jgi:hypothetical protein
VRLLPDTELRGFEPIILEDVSEGEVRVIAELAEPLRRDELGGG